MLNPDPIKYFKLDTSSGNSYGHHIVVECKTLRPEDQNYGETWVKRMGLALAKMLLGNIRNTYSGMTLLGGGSVDGSGILNQGQSERDALRSELTQKFPAIGMWHG